MNTGRITAGRLDLLIAAAVAGVTLVLYILTLQPDFGGPEDTPKFQFIGYALGTPHPPGYPLYVLLTHTFSYLPIGTIAYRANLFSAVMAAMACALAYAIARQLGSRPWIAACAAGGLATGASFWRNAVVAEVYSLAAVLVALTIGLLLAWGSRGTPRWLVAAFGAFAIGLGNHLTIAGVVPAFAVYVLTRRFPVWTTRVLIPSALLLAIGLGQYLLIVHRTRQHAPYLESRAETASELIDVVTAKRYETERFAFGPHVLLTEHLPVLASVIAQEFGTVGTVLFIVGAAIAVPSSGGALVLGAAAGTMAMLLNLAGDLKGFITPLMVLLWPIAAMGSERIARAARSSRRAAPVLAALGLAIAAVPPVANLAANYGISDRSRETADGRFLRSLFSQLPQDAGLVADDYWSDMAWHYYRLTGEAGPDRRIVRVGFDGASARRAVSEGHRVFALGAGATFLSAEGLRFRRATIEGPPLDDWLHTLPRGTIVVAAAAYAPLAADAAHIGHPEARPQGRAREFDIFAGVVRLPGSARRTGAQDVSLTIDQPSLGGRLPAFAGELGVTAGPAGARIRLAGRDIARTESGVVLAQFAPDGTLVRTVEWTADEPQRVPYPAAVYEFTGDAPCATLTADAWTDVSAVLAGGNVVAALAAIGSVAVDFAGSGLAEAQTRSTLLSGDGALRTVTTISHDGERLLRATLTRTTERRTVFRLALDPRPPATRARLQPGAVVPSLTMCALNPVHSLFERAGAPGVLKPDFESDAYFGPGWSDAQAVPTGRVRRGRTGATLFLPLEAAHEYRLILDLAADEAGTLDVLLNRTRIGSCDPRAGECELVMPPTAVVDGVNTLAMGAPDAADSSRFVFRGARLTVPVIRK